MKIIPEASLETIKTELRRMLNDGIRCSEVRDAAISARQEGDEIASIFNWAKSNFEYVADPHGRELLTSPRKLLEQYQATSKMHEDCESAALLISSLLGSIGHETKISILDCNLDGEYDHAIAQVFSPEINDWIFLDLTSERPIGWRTEYSKIVDITL